MKSAQETALEITTNGRCRDLLNLYELPPDVQIEFDYVREKGLAHDYRFVQYRGVWYDTFDTQAIVVQDEHTKPVGWAMYVEPDHPFAKWHSVISDTYFSGVLFHHSGDSQVVCATYVSRG